jgi:hypothetical protein
MTWSDCRARWNVVIKLADRGYERISGTYQSAVNQAPGFSR